jgi:hypothetical protein
MGYPVQLDISERIFLPKADFRSLPRYELYTASIRRK